MAQRHVGVACCHEWPRPHWSGSHRQWQDIGLSGANVRALQGGAGGWATSSASHGHITCMVKGPC